MTHLTADINDVSVTEIINLASQLKVQHKRPITISNYASKSHRQALMDYKQMA